MFLYREKKEDSKKPCLPMMKRTISIAWTLKKIVQNDNCPKWKALWSEIISAIKNLKISAVRSLADICFLHVLFGILIVLFN